MIWRWETVTHLSFYSESQNAENPHDKAVGLRLSVTVVATNPV